MEERTVGFDEGCVYKVVRGVRESRWVYWSDCSGKWEKWGRLGGWSVGSGLSVCEVWVGLVVGRF